MRIRVLAPVGELAGRPGDAFDALADIAEADGATRDDWIAKALASAGATSRSVPVVREPVYQIVEDTTEHALAVHEIARASMLRKIAQRLERAQQEADIQAYQRLAKK